MTTDRPELDLSDRPCSQRFHGPPDNDKGQRKGLSHRRRIRLRIADRRRDWSLALPGLHNHTRPTGKHCRCHSSRLVRTPTMDRRPSPARRRATDRSTPRGLCGAQPCSQESCTSQPCSYHRQDHVATLVGVGGPSSALATTPPDLIGNRHHVEIRTDLGEGTGMGSQLERLSRSEWHRQGRSDPRISLEIELV